MKTPDKSTIQAWLNGELEGNALREMEAWAEENADQLEKEMGWEGLSEELVEHVPADEEPPYAEFFNERVRHHAIELAASNEEVAEKASLWAKFQWLFAPAALAGMALCFFLGTRVEPKGQEVAAVLDGVYTPVSGVSSEVIVAGESTVIVLEGLEEIPESLDIVSGDSSVGVSPRMLVKAERETLYY
ncbi:hypothetical protein [Rubritalea tangerina]|uniref:Uncharacterized protein n=1 Tax=Rubritalea tangerina TaxID=430798 RepID=A0ABW4Z850_9BACT